MMDLQKRAWAEINLDNIEHNYKAMTKRLPVGCRFLGVVKADAYGHGAPAVAGLLRDIGCPYLAVACIDEAIELRQNNITLPILIFGHTPAELAEELMENDITQTVYSLAAAGEFSRRAERMDKRLKIHLKIDSGMGRLGFDMNREEDILSVLSLPGLYIEGIYTHFAVSDIYGDEFTENQLSDFIDITARLENKRGRAFKIKHCANSGAMLNYSESYLDMVRPGIALYGYYPGPDRGGIELKPAMELHARIVHIRDIEPGDTVSYGRTYRAKERGKIAVLPIGYADGLPRILSNNMEVLIKSRRAPQVGRICMDMCMVDISNIREAAVGDVVTIFGTDGEEFIPVEELSAAAGTISYEIVTGVSGRVPRIYIKDNPTITL